MSESVRALLARINEWMSLPDKNLALDKQRAILLLDESRKVLAAQSQVLADLAAEMQRFAENQRYTKAAPQYTALGQQVLAWAARLKALQEA